MKKVAVLRFKKGDRVLIADTCHIYNHQNKDNDGNVYAGTISQVYPGSSVGDFNYTVKWDKGAHTDDAWYHDHDLIGVASNNKSAVSLLDKEW